LNILLTGSQGFIGSYLCQELLNRGHEVIGLDNYSKYGKVSRPHDDFDNFSFYEQDVTKPLEIENFDSVDVIIAGAAMIGGISYFHKYAYDLLSTNERIMANTFDLAIKLYKEHNLNKIVVLSSSMVFENTSLYPTPEHEVRNCKPPSSTYGFQKLACEYFCQGANEQYGLPYNIIRPFNCVGVGEDESIKEEKILIGNHKMMMSHVLPDLIHRAINSKPNDLCAILGDGSQVRHYTNGKDIARGIRYVVEHDNSIINEDFNISSDRATSVTELATLIWNEIHGCDPVFKQHKPYDYDVQLRSPDVSKARNLLNFETEINLEESVKEVISYMRKI
jgi:nucleoside-diphosphate-sugar epimerase